jgi:molybdopterin molybdotransferase
MRGFSRRTTVEVALQWIDHRTFPLRAESTPLDQAAGRVLAESIVSRFDVPSFPRAMMDGFAVRAADTAGASTYSPMPLRIVAQILPGYAYDGTINAGEAARIMTGAPMPRGADAVIPAERTQAGAEQVEVLDEVPPQKHIGRRGEDIACGDTVLAAGRRLRPQDLGVLSSIGLAHVPVIRKPRVRIVITGNELLPSGSVPRGFQIVDANGPMLAALVQRDGGVVTDRRILPDTESEILAALYDDVDVVLVSGGSSVGLEDFAPRLVAQHGQLAIHGVAMRPSSPSGMGMVGERLVFLLPGNPVSCLCSYDFFAGRALRRLGYRNADWPYPVRQLPLVRKLVSQVGRVDYARVRVENGEVEPIAVAGASILSSTTRADGFVIVPSDCEGYPPGAHVAVYMYDEAFER